MSVYSTPSGAPAPRVRLDAISDAWNLTRAQMGTWTGAMALYFLVIFGVSFVLGLLTAAIAGTGESQTSSALSILLQIAANIVSGGIGAYFLGGAFKMALKQIRGEPIAVMDIFSGGDVFVPVWVATILIGLGTFVGFLLCILPGLLLATLWILAYPLIVDRQAGPVTAMKQSMNALRGEMWPALGFLLLAGICSGLGFFACGIGVIVTAPIYTLAIALLYQDFFGRTPADRGPSIEMPLPPPPSAMS